jgi:ATP-dependent helicase/nuclease subunit A
VKKIQHVMIRASAGSGKTYQLTNRFIELLVCGQLPERIIALTFTRKAAGEFFEGILTKLAEAAQDTKAAKKLAGDIGMPGTSQATFGGALRTLVDGMGRLSLGTIDSFFHRVLGFFPMEFGLGAEFEMMSEFHKQQARLHVLENLLTHHETRPKERDDLIESFRLSTAGQDSRNFVGSFEEHLKSCHELLLRVPDANRWGDPALIWPTGNPWTEQKVSLPDMVADWRPHLETDQGFTAALQNNWGRVADHLATWAPRKNLFARSPTLVRLAVENLEAMERGEWEFIYSRKAYCPSPEFSQKLARILRHCVAQELTIKLACAQGIHGLLWAFEERYDAQVRRVGRLTFADLPVLLAPREGRPPLGSGQLDLEYRLDGAFDHWLLDEFQDTSTVQWHVVENLIDEVAQDPDGARTFFCVGDQKQSIYQWRGGDPQLFDRVAKRYEQGTGQEFDIRSLDESWRSCPNVLKLINAVFGDAATLRKYDENETAAKRWNKIWNEHVSAKPLKETKGHSLYLTVEEKDQRWPLVANLLERLQPIANGLECAVLVQTNQAVREVVDHLRGALTDLPVVGESVTNPGADNPLGAALLSLFNCAAHPTDRFSRGHVRMTPLGALLPAEADQWEDAMRELQRNIHQVGFEEVAREWIAQLKAQLNDFSLWRARQFIELARQFDESGSRNIDEFLRFVPAQELAGASGANVVQVMTIHKAKGLTFDLTIVPDLEGSRLDGTRRDALHTHTDDEGEAEWILDLPPKEICTADPQLSSALAQARSEACYENLCKLYVALTRPRQGLYVITTTPSGSSNNYSQLLTETLAKGDGKPLEDSPLPAKKIFEEGDFGWVEEKPAKEDPPVIEPDLITNKRSHPRMAHLRPSSHGGTILRGASLFAPHGSDAASFGRAVHEIFEQIEWNDETSPELLKQFRQKNTAAADEVARCLDTKEIGELFKPDSQAEVWRERAFELVIDGEFCSGVFDRVVLRKDNAEIIDFKTDRVDGKGLTEAIQRHQPQLALYRRVLARLTGLEEDDITCLLVFTRPAQVMEA